jgi:hypothetical protein
VLAAAPVVESAVSEILLEVAVANKAVPAMVPGSLREVQPAAEVEAASVAVRLVLEAERGVSRSRRG